MSTLSIVIGVTERGSRAVLAAEALKKAAAALGAAASVETRSPDGVATPLDDATIAAADAVLLVGDVPADGRFAGKATTTATVEAVLADAGRVVAAAVAAAGSAAAPTGAAKFVVAITSCPTGIAHTFMAAEGVEQGAKALGHTVKVETQGSVGAQNTLTAEEIAAADLVIIAADTNVDLARFAGKRVFQSGTKPAIGDGKGLVARAFAEATVLGGAKGGAGRDLAAEVAAEKAARAAARTGAYKHLMTGVSYMLPFVVAGGLLIALAFALGGIYVYDDAHAGTLGQALFNIGAKAGFALMVPMLAGFIAYSIADRPGIAPGAIGGMLAGSIGAGFLGGIVAGFMAGYVVAFLAKAIRLPKNLEGLKPILLLPLLGTAITGLLMIYVVGEPVAAVLAAMTDWLKGLGTTNGVLLGIVIGAMMAFDMGGPVNKAAYTFATGLIASGVYTPMAAAMAAGMTPPLGIALATWIFRDRFTAEEREAGNAAAVLGISFITEGAIPFAAKDPMRVIPALMAGSATAGVISMLVGAELKVPHGGVFVLPIPNAVVHLGGYLVAIVAGTLVTAVLLRLLKKPATA
ncbi:PTS fructose transporter subunit IIC [Oharaeibacter diazotrophicus]|uniref:protein-N(pi)-phosphohistidine--D-fructose phosphotransferase n=2 Tax=Oharaeibacter diazotrophicus TaxID=1920512 RepID=A0A4R6R5M8_9HYPH|nr:fructose-specific PTS transporter subunit EIIC [Oharaeibacter diazotrophicus]TDP81203.1 PTS system D-fructose-specific IIB component (F1P-forming) (Frc family) /PTS system D-fructose-specific IIC component (F1P-forming) (Frc family) [Oharaeibacter diazotrophicus]BBE74803.1 PTS system fructose-specific EIIBC component [Pleomorphomonas sp. SM30]GLS75694.1 PTS fructose transporter subunit IIBC [Oharaeibacter diazotrophicus]